MEMSLFDLSDPSQHSAMVRELKRTGVLQLSLSAELRDLNEVVFDLSRRSMETSDRSGNLIDLNAGTGLNGWHGPGGLSNYNRYRSGFIFEGNNLADLGPGEADIHFVPTMTAWRDAIWDLGRGVLRMVATELELPPDYFETEMDVCSNSQFHMKRYHEAVEGKARRTDKGEFIKLFAHTDPSVVSILIHDGGALLDGARGLQVRSPDSSDFLPLAHCGWGVATVFVGSLLHRVTCGQLHSAHHRVAVRPEDNGQERLTATFFFQPTPDTLLAPLPCPLVQAAGVQGTNQQVLTYGAWKEQAYGKYYKGEKKPPRS